MVTTTKSQLLHKGLIFILLSFCIVFSFAITAGTKPSNTVKVQLAKVYKGSKERTIDDYLVSEKFDGIRAIWTGSELVTRNGNKIFAPQWFTQQLPNQWLDGELWTHRQDFQSLSSIVTKHKPISKEWREVSFLVFDMPNNTQPFIERAFAYNQLIEKLSIEHLKAVKQHSFKTNAEFNSFYAGLVKNEAEGVMLHLKDALHKAGRTDALLKLKPYMDAEAKVIAYIPGKGKYKGMVGSLRVKNSKGLEFSVGSGLSDAQRTNPPLIGTTITYRYHGYTKKGLPRFASFLKIYEAQ